MKNLILYTCLVFSYFFYAQTNNIYEVDYVLQLDHEVLNKSLKTMKNQKVKHFIAKHADTFEEVQAKLIFNAKAAKYAVRKQLQNDFNQKSNFFEKHAGGKSTYYYDNEKKIAYYTSTLINKTNVVYEREWKILKESEEILGFRCYKAELILDQEGKMFVWFTNEIPYPYGPLRFNNLPGLILKAEVKNGLITYLATNIKTKRKNKPIIEETDHRFMSEEEYMKELKKNNPLFEGF
ncbi:GLPGLI family protein [Psychroflexus salarius]|uniref:GLPGLI family protein n=1 Tax=Psychroflexus salarius TaxID=1155689 RepID=A0A1M4T185_9FLAO|nr:GLPGLI family protein [Psychroflexus salarius]SHE38246.1 GLPGLI family protein [Psychroflexus salarius]